MHSANSTTNRNNDCSTRDKCFPQYCSSKHCNIQVTHSSVGPVVWIEAYAFSAKNFFKVPVLRFSARLLSIQKKNIPTKSKRKIKCIYIYLYMDVSENSGTPKSSILIGFSIINNPFWGTPIWETPIYTYKLCGPASVRTVSRNDGHLNADVKFLSHCAPKEGRSEGIRGCWSGFGATDFRKFLKPIFVVVQFLEFWQKIPKKC